jgi:hypothetical protein
MVITFEGTRELDARGSKIEEMGALLLGYVLNDLPKDLLLIPENPMIYFSTLKETSFELYPSGSRMDQ